MLNEIRWSLFVATAMLYVWCAKITSLFTKFKLSHQLMLLFFEMQFCFEIWDFHSRTSV